MFGQRLPYDEQDFSGFAFNRSISSVFAFSRHCVVREELRAQIALIDWHWLSTWNIAMYLGEIVTRRLNFWCLILPYVWNQHSTSGIHMTKPAECYIDFQNNRALSCEISIEWLHCAYVKGIWDLRHSKSPRVISLILGLDIFLVQFICHQAGGMIALIALMLLLMLIIAVFTKDYCYRTFLKHSKSFSMFRRSVVQL